MIAVTPPLLAIIIVVVLFVIGMVALGIYGIRSGLRLLPRAEELGLEPAWHRQHTLLFGINNIIFALLLVCLLFLLLVTVQTLKIILLALGGIFLLLSVFLLVRSMLFAMRSASVLRERRSNRG